MKRALYAVLAVIVAVSVIVVGVKLREKANEDNIEIVTQAEVDRQIGVLKSQQPQAFKGPKGKMAEQSYRRALEQQVRINELIKKEAVTRGIAVSPDEVDAAVGQVRQAYASDKRFNDALSKQGLSLDQYKDNIRDQILMSKMMTEIAKDINVTQSEIKEFYERNKAEFSGKPLSQVVDMVKQRLLQQKRRSKFSEFVEELKKQSGQN